MLSSLAPYETLLNAFNTHLQIQKRRSPLTAKSYLACVKAFLSKGKKNDLREIDQGCMETHIHELAKSHSATSQALHVAALRNFFAWTHKQGLSKEDFVLVLVTPKRGKKLIRPVQDSDLSALIAYIQEQASPAERIGFALLFGLGLRVSEAHGLRWDDISWGRNEVKVLGKGKKQRLIPLYPELRSQLLRFRENSTSSPILGSSYSVRTMQRWAKKWGKSLNLEQSCGSLHPHKLRHSLATVMLRQGASLRAIQKLLGHKHLSSTERYTHINFEDLAKSYDLALPKTLKKAQLP